MTVKSTVVRKSAFTIILLSEEGPDLPSSLLWGVFVIWKVLHVLGTDHFENCLHQIKRNDVSAGAQGLAAVVLKCRFPGLPCPTESKLPGGVKKAFASYLFLSVWLEFPHHVDILLSI